MVDLARGSSRFGEWDWEGGVPVFHYTADQTIVPEAEWERTGFGPTRRHWTAVGNRRLQLFVDNEGAAAVFDEHHGLRWLAALDPHGTGVSLVSEPDRPVWGSRFADRPIGTTPVRTFGPTWFRIEAEADGVRLERTMLCPEGSAPWILVRVSLIAPPERAARLQHVEEWALRPRFLNVGVATGLSARDLEALTTNAERHVRYDVSVSPNGLAARETIVGDPLRLLASQWQGAGITASPAVFGPPATIMLQALGAQASASHAGDSHPVLRLKTEVELAAGERRDLWFRFGIDDGSACDDPASQFEASLGALSQRLPRAECPQAPQAAREIPWHAALLSGGACADAVIGGHTLGENSSYALGVGVNGAARDPLQYALALVYTEPDLALSVLRNTLSWGGPEGVIPWGLDGAKQPRGLGKAYDRPSDFGLWALWLAAEYAQATGDLEAFSRPLGFHPAHRAAARPLGDHLALQFDHLLHGVGLGPTGHIRMRSCDWADGYMGSADRERLKEEGESVLNSAMAAWVLPVWAALSVRLGDERRATVARTLAGQLRDRVAEEWNGRWFRRARCGATVVGDEVLFLEVQPWAILCGAADGPAAATLLREIDRLLRRDAPLGARQHAPLGEGEPFPPGESLSGGHWYALQGPLVWAASRVDRDFALDEWRRMSLAGHTAAFPNIWEGTLSGPDAYNAPESRTPGRTWGGCQTYPTNNPHAHAQPLLAYLRLLGVEPGADGVLRVGGGPGAFRSAVLEVNADGSGSLAAKAAVAIETVRGRVRGGPGRITW